MTGSAAVEALGTFLEVQIFSNATTRLTLSGPAASWYAFAFNATSMGDTPYTIVVNASGGVEERVLADHAAGLRLRVQSLTILSSEVDAKSGRRTVVVSRSSAGAGPEHLSFSSSIGALPVLSAHGSTPQFGYHGAKGRVSLTMQFVAVDESLCVCRDPDSNKGTIDGLRFNPAVCSPYPMSELLTTHNPICNISEYNGGLYCCHHGTLLLDADQIVPADTYTWRLKYRFYFEDFVPAAGEARASHQNLFRSWWSTEATNNEYDVPQSHDPGCMSGQQGGTCVHVLKSRFVGRDMLAGAHGGGGSQCMVTGDSAACANITLIEERDGGQFHLMYAAAHCHTPACMFLELWNDDTGELLSQLTRVRDRNRGTG